MATYEEIYNLREQGGQMLARVTVAITKAAEDIYNENVEADNHAARLLWAKTSMFAPKIMADQMLWAVLQNASIQANGNASTDSDIQFVVNGLVERFANGVA